MVIEKGNEVWFTAVVTVQSEMEIDVYIPDLGVTVHDDAFLPAKIKAATFIRAIYEDCMSRGVPIMSRVSNEEAQLLCVHQDMFVTNIKIEFGGKKKKKCKK